MSYDSLPILCRKCLDDVYPQAEIIKHLDEYINSLPEETRACEQTYRQRLRLCAECEHRFEHSCRLCGCYVQARAAKKRLRCPIAGAPRWLEETGEA